MLKEELQKLGKISQNVKKFINDAVKTYLGEIDHSKQYYQIIKDRDFLAELVRQGISNNLITFHLDAADCVQTAVCKECGGTVFNYECPILICDGCSTEHYLRSISSVHMCNECPSLSLGTCEIGKKILSENITNEHKTCIVSCGKKAFQGNHERIDSLVDEFAES